MADRTLTINHADGGSETYTLKTEDVLGVRSMQVDGETVTIDRTAPALIRSIIADGQTITIDTTREGVRTLTVDGTEITIDRTEEYNLPFSVEVTNYFSRLDAAGDTTYTPYKQPLANYIDSLVALGGAYWDTMLSATSFVGVGIQGITVPLRDGMMVPTNNNFVSADLDQLTGLKGDATTKDINTGLLGNDIAQNDGSLSVYQTAAVTSGNYTAGAGYNGVIGGGLFIRDLGSTIQCAVHGGLVSKGTGWASGLMGGSRSSSTTQTQRTNQTDYTFASASLAQITDVIRVFAAGTSPKVDARLATYHFGPALNLATLENLQETLLLEISAI